MARAPGDPGAAGSQGRHGFPGDSARLLRPVLHTNLQDSRLGQPTPSWFR
ncbi:hypothetical protein STRAU_0508 [Streptomyces aurantiacus JA 4570]|uniref:Uncharacterized protein n=1 Tax=Streptomyces aurantiacus JA 4570 TaxID=1286094 RepID=S3ZSZ4_9ACTN|nr:hypothetical protein STRAU_0508 [Streptomyces aurantiacus JA 4570]